MKFTVIENPIVEVKPRQENQYSFSLKILFPNIEMSLDTKPDNIAFLMKNLEAAMLAAVKMTNTKEVDLEDIGRGG